jgi:nucleotide-binding universal stress UspA family protein
MKEYKRILVVSRMIQSCRIAIQYGITFASNYKAELYILHSIYNPFDLRGFGMGTRVLAKEYEKSILDAKNELSNIVKNEKKAGMLVTELVREGEPTAEILKTIEAEKIDLLIMLAHTESHLEDIFFQRSNDELVRMMPCSIMLVKKEAGKA